MIKNCFYKKHWNLKFIFFIYFFLKDITFYITGSIIALGIAAIANRNYLKHNLKALKADKDTDSTTTTTKASSTYSSSKKDEIESKNSKN